MVGRAGLPGRSASRRVRSEAIANASCGIKPSLLRQGAGTGSRARLLAKWGRHRAQGGGRRIRCRRSYLWPCLRRQAKELLAQVQLTRAPPEIPGARSSTECIWTTTMRGVSCCAKESPFPRVLRGPFWKPHRFVARRRPRVLVRFLFEFLTTVVPDRPCPALAATVQEVAPRQRAKASHPKRS